MKSSIFEKIYIWSKSLNKIFKFNILKLWTICHDMHFINILKMIKMKAYYFSKKTKAIFKYFQSE